jgi:hypothetical protein
LWQPSAALEICNFLSDRPYVVGTGQRNSFAVRVLESVR